VLRAVDMGNRKTWAAGHNDRPVPEILDELRRERGRFVEPLQGLGLGSARPHRPPSSPAQATEWRIGFRYY
jgi:hypothetical protein